MKSHNPSPASHARMRSATSRQRGSSIIACAMPGKICASTAFPHASKPRNRRWTPMNDDIPRGFIALPPDEYASPVGCACAPSDAIDWCASAPYSLCFLPAPCHAIGGDYRTQHERLALCNLSAGHQTSNPSAQAHFLKAVSQMNEQSAAPLFAARCSANRGHFQN